MMAPCLFCGYEFDPEELGIYGCANCHGEGLGECPPPDEVENLHQLTIKMPCPPPALWPNNERRIHWAPKSKAIKAYRHQAWALTLEALGGWDSDWKEARITFGFRWPTKHRRDTLNAMAAMKSAVDGIVDSGLIDDDDSRHLHIGAPTASVDRGDPRVEILMIKVA